MAGYNINIEEKTQKNEYFREVLHTTQHFQLVVMSIPPKEDIGEEVHEIVDQFIRIESGSGIAVLDGQKIPLQDGTVIIIPAGVRHNIINSSAEAKLQLYTLYSPPHHKDKIIHQTKKNAMDDEEDHI